MNDSHDDGLLVGFLALLGALTVAGVIGFVIGRWV